MKSSSVYRKVVTLVVLGLGLAIAPAAGQAIEGTVVDSATGRAVGRGFVVLLDQAGGELGRALTGIDGTFRFNLSAPGTYTLRSERIAYRPAEARADAVQADEVRSITLRIPAIPLRLDAIEVESESQCRASPEEGRNTAALWDEARKALRAASWSAEHDVYVHTLHNYERSLDLRRRRVESEQTRVATGNYRTPFQSVPASQLMDEGYIVSAADGTWYLAPDANTLLDDSFIATHCFRVTRDRNFRGMIGLAFEPTEDRRLPDIAGALWLDEQSMELKSIEYSYRRVPGGIRDDRLGGSIEFLVMPEGTWIVSKWQIRKPQLVRYQNQRTGQIGPPELGGFADSGGHVTRIATRDGVVVYESPDLVTVSGAVFDSTESRALGGANVTIDGTGYEVTANARGEYEILALLDGEYTMSFDHIRIDSVGFSPEPIPVELRPGDRASVDLFIPPEDVILRRLCPDMRPGSGNRVLVGMVRNPSNGRGVADANIQAEWQNVSQVGATIQGMGQVAVTKSDVWGNYALCDLPMGRTIEVQATRDSVNFGIASVRFETGEAQTMDAISFNVPLRGYYMPGRIWSHDLVLFPPNCINRRRQDGSMLMEIIVTCEARITPRNRRRRR